MSLPTRFNLPEIEKLVAKKWESIWPALKATTQYDASRPMFSFIEGPPTANAPPGLHHVEVRVFKDVYCRYKYMQGYTVPRKGGWDCHGLPVEVQVEKKLGLETKKDVIDYGEEKFCNECRSDIFTYIKDWEVMTKRLAYLVDLDQPYRTLDNSYIESVWWSLKEIHKKGLLYRGHKVVPYCPRCETPLSSHEVALGYKDVTEPSVVVKMQDTEAEHRYYLAWTTTPWTLPANVCLAVNPDVHYAIVKQGDKEFVLAEDLVNKFFDDPVVKSVVKGKELVDKTYHALFPYYADQDAFRIVAEDYVTTDDGTGIVHQAPAFGEADYESTKKHGLPFINNVLPNGHFDQTVTDFQGKFVKKSDEDIIAWLETQGKLFITQKYTHSYPHCWRCSTPLLYYALESWFIEVSKIRDRLVELNQNITWSPNHIQDGRFGKWLEGAKDWALSRFKFWGTPLPVWECGCGELKVIGSLEELNKHRIAEANSEPLTLENFDLHKSSCDAVLLKCDKCDGTMERVRDVIDCWYDSGAAPFAQYHYPFENKDIFEKSFPYSFISEAIDQTRGWFYTLHVLGTILFDSNAYARCYVGGLLCDEHGDKMSKSKGNILKPMEVFDEYGVDAVRLNMCAYPLGENVKFGKSVLEQKIQPFLRILWNCHGYATSFFNDQGYSSRPEKPTSLNVEDRWILSKVNSLVKAVQHHLDNGEYSHATTKIQEFVENDLSRTYIKLIRPRTRAKDDPLAYTLAEVLDTTIKLMAPFAPYLSEALYETLWPTKASIHLDSWPKVGKVDAELEQSMDIIQELISATNYAREKIKRSVRWPVAKVVYASREVDESNTPQRDAVEKALTLFGDVFTDQVNAKAVEVTLQVPGADDIVSLNIGRIKRDYKEESDMLLKELDKLNHKEILDKLNRGEQYKVGRHNITLDHLNVQHEDPEDYVSAPFKSGRVYVYIPMEREHLAEGYAREIGRRVQALRKKAGMTKDQTIMLHIQAPAEWVEELSVHKEGLKEQVGAGHLILTSEVCTIKVHHVDTFKVKDLELTISMAIDGIEKDFL